MELKGKVAIVTGASKGIGRAIAERLSKQGCNVVVNYHKDENAAMHTLEICRKYAFQSIMFQADVSKREQVRRMIEETVRKFGRIDIVINNAGILGENSDPRKIGDDEWDRVMNINLKGAFIVIQESLKYMKKGKIVNVASIAGKGEIGEHVGAHYSASKGALIALTFNLAKHLGPDILVNAVAPGTVETDMIRDADKDKLRELTLTGKIAKPEDVAHAVLFLLENDQITGEIIDVNGGRLMD